MHPVEGKRTPASDYSRLFPIFAKNVPKYKVDKRGHLPLPKMVILRPKTK